MRIIVCGGRDYDDEAHIHEVLRRQSGPEPWSNTLIHGAAPGADRLAARAAHRMGWRVLPHPARWELLGPIAGPTRNQEMVDGGADLCIAFPGGKGTADCVLRAKRAHIPVVVA